MYYISLFLLGWMLVGLFYGVYIVWVSDSWKVVQEYKKRFEPEHGKEAYYLIFGSKKVFLVVAILLGAWLPYSHIKAWLKDIFKSKKNIENYTVSEILDALNDEEAIVCVKYKKETVYIGKVMDIDAEFDDLQVGTYLFDEDKFYIFLK